MASSSDALSSATAAIEAARQAGASDSVIADLVEQGANAALDAARAAGVEQAALVAGDEEEPMLTPQEVRSWVLEIDAAAAAAARMAEEANNADRAAAEKLKEEQLAKWRKEEDARADAAENPPLKLRRLNHKTSVAAAWAAAAAARDADAAAAAAALDAYLALNVPRTADESWASKLAWRDFERRRGGGGGSSGGGASSGGGGIAS
jgi:hypothetical protein